MSYPQPPQGPQQPFQQQMPYGQPPQFAPQQPKKKAKKWPWVVGVLAFLFVIGSISNGMDLLSLSSSIKFMITGGVLLTTVTIDAVLRRRR